MVEPAERMEPPVCCRTVTSLLVEGGIHPLVHVNACDRKRIGIQYCGLMGWKGISLSNIL